MPCCSCALNLTWLTAASCLPGRGPAAAGPCNDRSAKAALEYGLQCNASAKARGCCVDVWNLRSLMSAASMFVHGRCILRPSLRCEMPALL
jgi:hypothetical protein